MSLMNETVKFPHESIVGSLSIGFYYLCSTSSIERCSCESSVETVTLVIVVLDGTGSEALSIALLVFIPIRLPRKLSELYRSIINSKIMRTNYYFTHHQGNLDYFQEVHRPFSLSLLIKNVCCPPD